MLLIYFACFVVTTDFISWRFVSYGKYVRILAVIDNSVEAYGKSEKSGNIGVVRDIRYKINWATFFPREIVEDVFRQGKVFHFKLNTTVRSFMRSNLSVCVNALGSI